MDKITHFEIPADDTKRAQKFYSDAFGWTVAKVPEMPYWMITTAECDENQMPKEAGAINGGMYQREGNEKPTVVVHVDSLDAALEKVKEAGGSVAVEKREVGNMGFYAKITDTEGNVIGVWETKK